MGIRVRLCSDWSLREADILSDYPQTSVSCIVRTQYPYFAQRYAVITGFGPLLLLLLNFYLRKKRSLLPDFFFNDPDGVRTHDLRRDRAAL